MSENVEPPRPVRSLHRRRDGRLLARAAVLTGPRTVEVRELPVADPGPGQIRIRLEGCGVCGSNLPVWQGRPWFRYPLAAGDPGHEGWGRVEAAGSGAGGLREGDRVAALGSGAFGEVMLAEARAALPVPAALAGMPAPGEPLACAVNVFRRSGIEAGQTVAVVGVGFIGAAVAQLAAAAGARVIALSRRPFALELARRAGAAEALSSSDWGAAEARVAELTGGKLCDRVIEAAGLQATLDLSAKLCRERGRLVIAGYHQDGPRTVDLQLWNWRGLDVVNAHERDPAVYLEGMRLAFEALAERRLDPDLLFTHRYPLESIGAAFEAMEARPDGFVKGLVIP